MEDRIYELIFICRPDTPPEELDKLIAAMEHAAVEKSGKVEKAEKWGNRRLAYRVHRYREGAFVYLLLRGSHGGMVHEMERRLSVHDAVIKYQTVRIDEDLKRQAKLTARRERRAARRPRRPAAPPASAPPAAAPPATPGPAANAGA